MIFHANSVEAFVTHNASLNAQGEQLEVEMSISFGERLASSARNQGSRNDVEIALGADAARVLQSKVSASLRAECEVVATNFQEAVLGSFSL